MSRSRVANYSKSITILVLAAGVGLSLVIAYLLHLREVAATRSGFEGAARDRSMALQRGIESSVLVGKSVGGFFLSSQNVTQEEFARFTDVLVKGTDYINAVQWMPRVADKGRVAYETEAGFQIREWGAEGYLLPAARRDTYFPVHFMEPRHNNEALLGVDFAANASWREALEYARDRNLPGVSARLALASGASDVSGISMCLPVYEIGTAIDVVSQRRAHLKGVVALVLDIPALVESSLNFLRPAGIHYSVSEKTSDGNLRLFYYHRSRTDLTPVPVDLFEPISTGTNMRYTDTFAVGGRQWVMTFVAADGYFQDDVSLAVWSVFVSGSIFTLLLFSYLRLVQTRERDLLDNQNQLEVLVSQRTRDLQEINRELEAYSYSIAHDLRAPLRAISGFSQILIEDCRTKLGEEELGHFDRIVRATSYMECLIDDILELSRVTRADMIKQTVDMSAIARRVSKRLQADDDQQRKVTWKIHDGVVTLGDPDLLSLMIGNLLGNAYKFTVRRAQAVIEFGTTSNQGSECYFVRDNGVGFDMAYADKLFGVFQRLHRQDEFPGTGIGLATVRRIVERHNGRIWAESQVDEGATFYFSLSAE